jgi:uncharacterized protein (TIGR00369 family)
MPVDKNSGKNRNRTITWEDPKISSRMAADISGLDYLCDIRDGRISPPPVARLVGYRLVEVEERRTLFELEPAGYHYNPFSSVHGGMITTLLDTSITAAVITTLPKGFTCSTLELKVHFIRPVFESTGVIRSQGSIIHLGRHIAVAEGTVRDLQGKKYAHATSTCMIIKIGSPAT